MVQIAKRKTRRWKVPSPIVRDPNPRWSQKKTGGKAKARNVGRLKMPIIVRDAIVNAWVKECDGKALRSRERRTRSEIIFERSNWSIRLSLW